MVVILVIHNEMLIMWKTGYFQIFSFSHPHFVENLWITHCLRRLRCGFFASSSHSVSLLFFAYSLFPRGAFDGCVFLCDRLE